MLVVTKILQLVILAQPVSQPTAVPIDPCESVVIHQARAALAELEAAAAVHRPAQGSALTAVYEGTHALEAHLMRPGMVWTRPVRLELTIDPQAGALLVKKTTSPQSSPQVQTTLMLHARAAEQPTAEKPFVELESGAADAAAAEAAGWFPSIIVQAALKAGPSCRLGSIISRGEQSWSPITFMDAAGQACTLLIDAAHRVGRIERLASHPRLGDVCHWTQFKDWEQREGVLLPRRLSRFVVGDSTTSRYDLSLTSMKAVPLSVSTFLLPQEHVGDIPGWGQPLPPSTGMEFVDLASGVCAVEIAAADQRVIVIERADDLVLLGAPDGDAVCVALLRALKDRFVGKSISLAAPSHHHPASSGGLRALAAAGAAIIVPREMESFVRALIARPTSLGPPAVPGPPQPRIELFDGETTIDCGHMRVKLINIAEHSAHAFSYVVFYFPDQELLFEDDLGYFPLSGATKVGPRLMGLAGQLEAQQIRPRRLIQGWPVKNVLREVEWSVVAGLVQAEREKQAKP